MFLEVPRDQSWNGFYVNGPLTCFFVSATVALVYRSGNTLGSIKWWYVPWQKTWISGQKPVPFLAHRVGKPQGTYVAKLGPAFCLFMFHRESLYTCSLLDSSAFWGAFCSKLNHLSPFHPAVFVFIICLLTVSLHLCRLWHLPLVPHIWNGLCTVSSVTETITAHFTSFVSKGNPTEFNSFLAIV